MEDFRILLLQCGDENLPKIPKILEYRRARWLNDGQDLEQLLRAAWAAFPTQNERTVKHKNKRLIAGARARDFNGAGFAIHCVRYVEGQGVGTIPKAPAPHIEIGERRPDDDENFLNADFCALIKGNHAVVLNCGRNAGSLRLYLDRLFLKAEFGDPARQFELLRVGRPAQLAMIERVGVKTVDFDFGIAEATAAYLQQPIGEEGVWGEIKRGVGGLLNAISQRDGAIANIREAQQGTVRISIDVAKGDLAVAREGLTAFAEDVAEDDDADGYTISLSDGRTRIKSNELIVSKGVRLQEVANSVSVAEAWDAMATYMHELFETGQIEA